MSERRYPYAKGSPSGGEPRAWRILVAFEDPKTIRLLERTLLQEGYQVLTAVDGRETLKKVKSDAPDMVILNTALPSMSGFEVVECMKTAPSTGTIPVMFIHTQGSAEDEIVFRYFRSGADCFLTAPINVLELTTFIRRIFHSIASRPPDDDSE